MKILILDTVFPIGHQLLNNKLISFISTKGEVIVLNYEDYYNEKSYDTIDFVRTKFLFKQRKNLYLNLFVQILNSISVGLKSIFIKYDCIVFFTFDTIAFSVLSIFLHKQIYLFHHNNVDHLENKWKFKIFKLYKNHVNHIVFADFIKEYLIKKEVSENHIFVLNHPLTNNVVCKREKMKNENSKLYIGLGHANDETLIDNIVDYENKCHILHKNNIYLILRSAVRTYNGKNIKIINGYLQKEEYESYFEKADGILLLYSTHFKNRFSNAILDAFRHKKKVIGNNIPIVKYFNQLYPQSCIFFDSMAVLFECIQSLDVNFVEYEYNLFLENHSDEIVKKKLCEILDE